MSAARKLVRKTKARFDAQVGVAQEHMRIRGKRPIDKGVLDRWRGLTIDERVDLAYLESQGFDPEEARALAMAGSRGVRKADFDESQHPRDDNGEFAGGTGGAGSDSLGKTSSGKSISGNASAKDAHYANFSKKEHQQAADAHNEAANKAHAANDKAAHQHHVKLAIEHENAAQAARKKPIAPSDTPTAGMAKKPLSAPQKHALDDYAKVEQSGSGNYQAINAALNGKSGGNKAESLKAAKHINAAIEQNPLPAAKTFYRGTGMPDGAKVGDIIRSPALTSVSSDRKIAEKFAKTSRSGSKNATVLEIKAAKGTPVLNVNQHTKVERSEEKEHLFGSNQGFRITSIGKPDKNGIRKMTVEAVNVQKSAYTDAYLRSGKTLLPDWQHRQLHQHARSSAGGKTSSHNKKLRKQPDAAELEAHKQWLENELRQLDASINKSPTLSEVHVDAPVGGKKRVGKRHVVPTQEQPGMDPPSQAKYLDAQRLLRGMDYEMIHGASSPSDARKLASQNLAVSMGAYDRAFPSVDVDHLGGMDLDLASGNMREAGYLGIDLFPYDYGTTVHDLSLGIPFETGSARRVRLNDAFDALPDFASNPSFLMQEIERVLGQGGRLYYQGPVPLTSLVDMPTVVPGLQLLPDSTVTPDVGPISQVFGRVALRVPAVYGADPQFLGTNEDEPVDLLIARLAMAQAPSANVLMANLVTPPQELSKSAVRVEPVCRVVKRDSYKQVILGCVLVPDVEDSQGDVMTAEDIEKTAHDFMINARVVGAEHEGQQDGSSVVESYIAPSDLAFDGGPYGPQTVPKGSWVLGVHVGDDANWQAVLDGEFTGFSVGGWGDRVAM